MEQNTAKLPRIAFTILMLLLGTWIGSILCNFLAATVVFDYVDQGIDNSSVAGSIAGDIFFVQGFYGLAATVTSLVLILWLGQRNAFAGKYKFAIAMLIVVLLLILIEMFWITPTIQNLRAELGQQFGSVNAAPEDNPLRRRFGMMHGLSAMRALGELFFGAIAFIITAMNYDPSRDR